MEQLSFPEFLWRTGLTGEEAFHLFVISSIIVFYAAWRRGWLGKSLPATPPLTRLASHLSGLGALAAIVFFATTACILATSCAQG